jgi:predicted ATPase
MSLPVHLRKVAIKDYKSIASCDVELEPLTFLVGPNGGGKSNFLDALRFCADALRHSLDQAVRDRGGINEVRRRSAGRPNHFGIKLTLDMRPSLRFQYHFEIGARSAGAYAVQREECEWQDAENPEKQGSYAVKNGTVVQTTIKSPPPASADRLYLVTVAGYPPLGRLYAALSSMGFYSLNPERIRDLQNPDQGELLSRDGSNLSAVFDVLTRREPQTAERVLEFLRLVVPGIEKVQSRTLGPKETLEFVERAGAEEKGRRFLASSMSDGTLRALGVIVALYQRPGSGASIPLVGIEEPEMALHPAAAGVLLDCLREASIARQALVTSHSPDLLDRGDIDVESILSVSSAEGRTFIGPVNSAGKRILQQRLRTAGDLMRINQMEPDWSRIPRPTELQLRLFR